MLEQPTYIKKYNKDASHTESVYTSKELREIQIDDEIQALQDLLENNGSPPLKNIGWKERFLRLFRKKSPQ